VPDWLSTSIFWICLVFMLVGLFGLIIPIFPGIIVIWLAVLAYGLVSGFTTLGWIMFTLITILLFVGVTIDNILMNTRAHKEGAAWSSLILGMLGGILGTIFLPPLGGIIAAPLAILLIETIRQHDVTKALRTLRGLLIGWGMSFVARFFIGLVMIGLWLAWALNR
jgi:uncharacterized protein YqgC (DUF456 family)